MKQYNIFRIKEVAKEKGVKCKDLATALGVCPQYVSHLFHGRGIGVGMLLRVATALGVGVRDLIVKSESDVRIVEEAKGMLAEYLRSGNPDPLAVARMIVAIWRIAWPENRPSVMSQFVRPILPLDFDASLCRAYLTDAEAAQFSL